MAATKQRDAYVREMQTWHAHSMNGVHSVINQFRVVAQLLQRANARQDFRMAPRKQMLNALGVKKMFVQLLLKWRQPAAHDLNQFGGQMI